MNVKTKIKTKLLLLMKFRFDVPIGEFPETIIRLSSGEKMSEDCVGSGNNKACCTTGRDEDSECCSNEYDKNIGCLCYWNENALDCEFNNITQGNYCINVELVDQRCVSRKLWSNHTLCSWYFPYSIAENNQLVTSSNDNPWITVTVTAVVVFIILALLMLLYYKAYRKVIYNQYISFAPARKKTVSVIIPQKIMLLYPRDCKAFMDVMKVFRSILQETLIAQVYDIWDNRNWNDVHSTGPLWAVKYLIDPNVKILLVNSPCSKIIEEAILSKKTFEYNKPTPRDDVYFCALKSALDLLMSENNRYNRFFIVRLDSKDCMFDKPAFLNTIYTLPQHLKEFIMDILNSPIVDVILNPDRLPKIHQLQTAISELENFRLNNEEYLSELIWLTS
ncbi:uncharacterized protein LOC106667700 isoform X3 [Cimex lectularius]|uniref:SEFIR domain-containing protein n=1 Tax=Cimex lectularius TaxID=79782 RepID=A0A8I6TMH4_CIMLE|nr:uncharacterized protein LOC106667700 isoform X3 [Cimex lectularius]